MKTPLWYRHPAVRTGSELSFGERSADHLKRVFGSWAFLLGVIGAITLWIVSNKFKIAVWDSSDLLLLNLCLSIMAGLQGGALQIASNRGDRISSELAVSTFKNGETLLALNQRQIEMLERIELMSAQIDHIENEVDPDAQSPLPTPRPRPGLGWNGHGWDQ